MPLPPTIQMNHIQQNNAINLTKKCNGNFKKIVKDLASEILKNIFWDNLKKKKAWIFSLSWNIRFLSAQH